MREKPKFTCGERIDGPSAGGNTVQWRKYCKRPVKREGQRCANHRDPDCTCGLGDLEDHEAPCPMAPNPPVEVKS